MKKTFLMPFLAIAVLLLSSCATVIQPHQPKDLGTEHVLDKNYTIGIQQEVYVGEAMVEVEDYYVTKYSSQMVKPTADFTAICAVEQLRGSKNSLLPIVGSKVINGFNYRVVRLENTFAHILIDKEGRAHNKVLVGSSPSNVYTEVLYDYAFNPSDVRFVSEIKQEVSKGNGFVNYELIYNGTDGKSFNITYREFSPDNLARASFFQTLTYSTDSGTIRFKKNLIKVYSVDNEKIVYTVLEDGYD